MGCKPCQARAAARQKTLWRVTNQRGTQVYAGSDGQKARAVAANREGYTVHPPEQEQAR